MNENHDTINNKAASPQRLSHPRRSLENEIKPLLPKQVTHHPLGCHRKRVEDRSALKAIFFVLKTGCQWNALNATGICSSSSAHRRSQEWNSAGEYSKSSGRSAWNGTTNSKALTGV